MIATQNYDKPDHRVKKNQQRLDRSSVCEKAMLIQCIKKELGPKIEEKVASSIEPVSKSSPIAGVPKESDPGSTGSDERPNQSKKSSQWWKYIVTNGLLLACVGIWKFDDLPLEHKSLLLGKPEVFAPLSSTNVEVVSGDWQIENEEGERTLIQKSIADASDGTIVFGNENWHDYDLSFKVRRESQSHGFRVLIHWKDQDHFESFALGSYFNGIHDISYILDGRWQRDNKTFVPRPSPTEQLIPGQWYDFTFKIRGSKYSCLLGENLIFEGELEPFQNGRIAFASWEGSARFKDILVKSYDPKDKESFSGLPL